MHGYQGELWDICSVIFSLHLLPYLFSGDGVQLPFPLLVLTVGHEYDMGSFRVFALFSDDEIFHMACGKIRNNLIPRAWMVGQKKESGIFLLINTAERFLLV